MKGTVDYWNTNIKTARAASDLLFGHTFEVLVKSRHKLYAYR